MHFYFSEKKFSTPGTLGICLASLVDVTPCHDYIRTRNDRAAPCKWLPTMCFLICIIGCHTSGLPTWCCLYHVATAIHYHIIFKSYLTGYWTIFISITFDNLIVNLIVKSNCHQDKSVGISFTDYTEWLQIVVMHFCDLYELMMSPRSHDITNAKSNYILHQYFWGWTSKSWQHNVIL